MSAPARSRLTPHQAEVYRRLSRVYVRVQRPVRFDEIGSAGALDGLRRKGYVQQVASLIGPRGGETTRWVPIVKADEVRS